MIHRPFVCTPQQCTDSCTLPFPFSLKSTLAADLGAAVALIQGLSASIPYGAAVAIPSSFQPPQQEGPIFPITARDAKWRALAVLTYLHHATTDPSKRLPAPDACHFPGIHILPISRDFRYGSLFSSPGLIQPASVLYSRSVRPNRQSCRTGSDTAATLSQCKYFAAAACALIQLLPADGAKACGLVFPRPGTLQEYTVLLDEVLLSQLNPVALRPSGLTMCICRLAATLVSHFTLHDHGSSSNLLMSPYFFLHMSFWIIHRRALVVSTQNGQRVRPRWLESYDTDSHVILTLRLSSFRF